VGNTKCQSLTYRISSKSSLEPFSTFLNIFQLQIAVFASAFTLGNLSVDCVDLRIDSLSLKRNSI